MITLWSRLSAVLALGLLTACTGFTMQSERPRYYEYYPESLQSMSASDYYNNDRQIALLEAAAAGDANAMQAAVNAGADVNAVGRDGLLPLYWVMAQGSLAGTTWLLEHGADPNRYTQMPNAWRTDRESAMSLATDLEQSQFLEALLTHGGDPNQVPYDDGGSLLFYAIVPRRPENARLLVEHGADVNHQANFGDTPLYKTVTGEMYDISIMLLKAGANPKVPSDKAKKMVGLLRDYGNRATYLQSHKAYPKLIAELQKRGMIPTDFQYDPNNPQKTW